MVEHWKQPAIRALIADRERADAAAGRTDWV